MPILRFEGSSDDTFGEIAHFNDDYDCCASGEAIVFEVRAGDEGVHVFGQYSGNDWPDGTPPCWMIGIQQLNEGAPIPAWPIRFEGGGGPRDYTYTLVIEAPDGVTMRCLSRSDEAEDWE